MTINDLMLSKSKEPNLSLQGLGSDGVLLEAIRRKSENALETAIARYGQSLTRAAYLYLGDSHAAEDIAQLTFMAAWDGAHRTSEETNLKAWLFGILYNQCRKNIRGNMRRRKRERKVAEERELSEGDEVGDDKDLFLSKMREGLSKLNEKDKEVILLRFEQKFSIQECAESLGIPEGTVKSRTHGALGRLKNLMGVPS